MPTNRRSWGLILLVFSIALAISSPGARTETTIRRELENIENIDIRVGILDLGRLMNLDREPALEEEATSNLVCRTRRLEDEIGREFSEQLSVDFDTASDIKLFLTASVRPDDASGMCAVHISAKLRERVVLPRKADLPASDTMATTWESDSLLILPMARIDQEIDGLILAEADNLISEIDLARNLRE